MKPEEFIDKWLGWAKNKEEINDEILNDLDAMNKALTIPAVVGRSEPLVCDVCEAPVNVNKAKNWIICTQCGYQKEAK